MLFYHRHLRRLVAVELKLEKFSPHKGQMELYLRWLDQNDRAEGEASPIGLIFVRQRRPRAGGADGRDSANIRVAHYLHLPDVQVLQSAAAPRGATGARAAARLAPPDNKG